MEEFCFPFLCVSQALGLNESVSNDDRFTWDPFRKSDEKYSHVNVFNFNLFRTHPHFLLSASSRFFALKSCEKYH